MFNARIHANSLRFVLSCALVACGGEDDTLDSCPLDADSRAMVEETIHTETLITSWVLDSAGSSSIGFGLNLAGAELTQMSVVSMMMPCMSPTEFDYSCMETDIDSELLQCTRASCHEANVWAAETWYADLDHEASLERHGLAWDAPRFAGTGSTTQNPIVKWYSDVTDDTAPEVWAEASHEFQVDIGGELYDNSYDLSVRASHSASASSLDLDVTFPGLSAEGEVQVAFDSDGATHAGTVTVGGTQLAALGLGGDGEITFQWTEDCGGMQ